MALLGRYSRALPVVGLDDDELARLAAAQARADAENEGTLATLVAHAIRGTIRHGADDGAPGVSLREPSLLAPPPVDRFATARRIAAAWNDRSGDTVYVVVPDRLAVPEDVRRAAERGFKFAVDDLELSRPPGLHFFAADRDARQLFPNRFPLAWPSFRDIGRTLGLANAATWTVGVDADLTSRWALEVAAHEVFHLAAPGASEAEAEAYGRWALGRLSVRWAA